MTKTIELTQGQHAVIDDMDWNLAKQFKWNAKKDKNNFYAKTNIKRPDTGKYTTLHHDEKFKEFIIDLKFNQRAKRVKGYWFATREQKYLVYINRKYVGRFNSPVDAREAYLGALMDLLIDEYS